MQRIRQSAPATLSVVLVDQYGSPTAAEGDVTVAVTTSDGTELVASTTATVGADTGVYTVPLTGAQTSTLDILEATWHDVDADTDWVTKHRIVGGFLFTIDEARAFDDVLADTVKYPAATLAAKRDEVEDEVEWICDRAFVPSFDRVTCDGTGTDRLTVGKHDIRRIRAVTVYSTLGGTGTALSATELASIAKVGGGDIRRTDGGIFTWGTENVVVEVEYGLDGPDDMLAAAAKTRLRSRLFMSKSQIPERTRSWTDPNGNSYTFTGPDAYRTGIDSVDAVYMRFSLRTRDGDPASTAVVPASRTLSFDPQYWGLYRGGPR